MNTANTRVLQVDDLPSVTAIHLAAFPKSALGQLGSEAVTRYYLWQLQGPHDAVAIGLLHGERLIGFCFAGIFRGALSGFLDKNRGFLIWRVLTHPWLISAPFFRERIFLSWNALMHRSYLTASQPTLPIKSFGILAIAIDPQNQNRGEGKRLMAEIEKIATEHFFSRLHLTVDINNMQAIKFYENLGWKKILLADGRWLGSMSKDLANACE